MKFPYFSLLLLLFISHSTYASKTIEDIRFILEPKDKVENNRFQFGIQLFLSNQKQCETKGYLNGKFGWKNISIQSKQITKIDKDVLYVDHNQIRHNNHQVDLEITILYKRQTYTYKHVIDFPSLDSMRLVNRSIHAYQENYLRVYGYFSNGKTYLLTSETELPGFSVDELSIQTPYHIAQRDLFLYYHPEWNELEHDVPIAISCNQISEEVCLKTDFSTPIRIERIGKHGINGNNGNSGASSDDGYDGYPGDHGWDGGFGQPPNDVFAYIAEKDGYLLC